MSAKLCLLIIYIILMNRKVCYKDISFVEKIDYMIQQRQIVVVKVIGKQIDIEDLAYTKYAGTCFQSIVCMLIFDIVIIKRNAAVL